MAKFNPTDDTGTYLSHDVVPHDDAGAWPQEFLNSCETSGLPPHKLELKVGSPVNLMRNLTSGLANGTRCICRNFGQRYLDVEDVGGPLDKQRVYLPRIKLTPSDTRWPLNLQRRQFPVKPAFAMTINKAQGQTFKRVGVYLRRPLFCPTWAWVTLCGCIPCGTAVRFAHHGTYGPDNSDTSASRRLGRREVRRRDFTKKPCVPSSHSGLKHGLYK